LGRSAENIVENNLLATDFSNDSVHVQFKDGTDLTFRHAFYVGETPADGSIHLVAVFTEHCGYHEFWIGLGDRISAISKPVAQHAPSDEDVAWDSMAPVGREFGSPDYDRQVEEDAKKFASDMGRWIQQSSTTYAGLQLEDDEVSHARNVQLALHELGQDVTLDVAASVWKSYSQSIMASWMAGAETVAGAARTLYVNCPRYKKSDISSHELNAIADAAKGAADRAGSAIDDAMAFIAASNKRIDKMESDRTDSP
jgi:hypothetical protein